jgi:5-methylcytosine-specific restriction enzyme subunit McrC
MAIAPNRMKVGARLIPITNLYYLLLYAWDKFVEGSQVDVGTDESPDLPNLLAKVLVAGVKKQLRRGLNKDYINEIEELAYPRGRFLIAETVKLGSLANGRAVCAFDELSVDTTLNRILKATITRLQSSPSIARPMASDLAKVKGRMVDVAKVKLCSGLFQSTQLTGHSGHYGLLMKVCRLVLDMSLPEEGGTSGRFADILEDEIQMNRLFEAFVRNFYRSEQSRYRVKAEVIAWDAQCAVPSHQSLLPDMITDVTLRSLEATIVIDAKFYRETLVTRYGGRPRIRSGHLYQLQSYLTNMERSVGNDASAEGILLYPSPAGQELRIELQLARHRVRVWSIDLSREWRYVHDQLLKLISLPPFTSG